MVNSATVCLVAAFEFDRRAQQHGVGAGDGADTVFPPSNPGDDAAVIEAEDDLHRELHRALLALDDAHEIDAPPIGCQRQ